jgi:hypothetical protein
MSLFIDPNITIKLQKINKKNKKNPIPKHWIIMMNE